MSTTLTDVDRLVKEQLLSLRERMIKEFSAKHPQLYAMINGFLSGKKNRFGLQVTEAGNVVGTYTLLLEGIQISKVEESRLEPEFNHPFMGVIKPYIAIEKASLEKILADEQRLLEEPLQAMAAHLPGITIRFLA